jgi:hypothetical protein
MLGKTIVVVNNNVPLAAAGRYGRAAGDAT